MYLWKYWRESRIAFALGVLVVVLLTALSFTGNSGDARDPYSYPSFASVLLMFSAAPLAIFAVAIGSSGTGRNLGEGAGAYLLTRSRRRSWFVWSDWVYGLMLVALLVIFFNLFTSWIMYRSMRRGGVPLDGILFHGNPAQASLAHLMGLNAISNFLFCGLIFGVVYLATIIAKDARGAIVGAGVLAGYMISGVAVPHYWHVHLPSLLLRPYLAPAGHEVSGIADHLGVAMVVRTGLMVLFPIAAQMVLERADI